MSMSRRLIARRPITELIIAMITLSVSASFAGEPLHIGRPLPPEAAAIPLLTPDGTGGSLAEITGERGLLVIFTANTCAYSVDWRDRIPGLAELGDRHQIGFALVNSNARKRKTDDSPDAMALAAAEHFPGVTYWIDRGSKLADALGATRTPEVFLFDGDRKLVYHGVIDDHSGPIAEVEHHFTRDAVDSLIHGSPLPEATAPLGCAILRPRKRRPQS